MLGPVEVRTGATVIDVGPSRQRCVLAALAVDASHPVLLETLIERVWGHSAPDRARHTLYVYIARLRRALAEAGVNAGTSVGLRRSQSGYVLDVDAGRVDVTRFRSLTQRARDPSCHDSVRVELLRNALNLWRGTPLGDVPGEWAAQVREGWRRLHVGAAVAWAQAELRLGHGDEIIAPLTDLVTDWPVAEPLVSALMRSLHAAGRSAEALDVFTATRQRLIEELGINPGRELRQTHLEVLRDDLDASSRSL